MASPTEFDGAWTGLQPAFRHCLELAYRSLTARGLAVGSVITDSDGVVVASGRNRAYDPPGGSDRLQGNALAHAEMNALAAIPIDVDLGDHTLWSTQHPCSMCAAAIEFTRLGTVCYLAADPAFVNPIETETASPHRSDGTIYKGPHDTVWGIVANLLFLHNVAWLVGAEGTMVARNREVEPETVNLVLGLVSEGFLVAGAEHSDPIERQLRAIWPRVLEAATQRNRRLEDRPGEESG